MDCDQMMFFQHVPEIFKEEICAKLNIYIKKVLKGETNAVDAPVLLKFTIDYDKWAANNELRPVLLEILNEPLQSQKDIQMATWCFTTAILYRKQINGLQMHQVHCAIRISNLPMTRKLQFVPFGYPARLSLSFMRCVLHSFSDRCTYVRQSIWFCPKQCPADQNHILNGEYSDIPKCSSCCTNLQENEHRRSTYNCRFIEVFDARSVETPTEGRRIFRSVKVKLSDELCDEEMKLGQIYHLIGTFDIFTMTYIAWNFLKIDN